MSDCGHILVLDDEPSICAIVKRALEGGGFRVTTVASGPDMTRALSAGAVDLLVLDLMLPGEDGLVLLRDIRATRDLPVVVLTGRGEPVDRVLGLELGADDYIAKPFEPRELVARVRSVLRRTQRPATAQRPETGILRFDSWCLNLQSRQLTGEAGQPVALTTAQFDVLAALDTHPNRVLSRDQLLDYARDREASQFDRSIDVHIGHIRKKIERDPKKPELIQTVHGHGYLFTPTVTQG